MAFALEVGSADVVVQEAVGDLYKCGAALSESKNITASVQKASIALLKSMKLDTRYTGILKSLTNGKTNQLDNSLAMAENFCEKKQTLHGASEALGTMAERIDVMRDASQEKAGREVG